MHGTELILGERTLHPTRSFQMRRRWFFSQHVSRIMWIGTLLAFLFAESLVIVASVGLTNAHPPQRVGYLLLNILLTVIPVVASIRGYHVAARLRAQFGPERDEAILLWLSRQFLTLAIFAYAGIAANASFIIEVLHGK